MALLGRWLKPRNATDDGAPDPSEGCDRIAACAPRNRATIHGRVTNVREDGTAFTATLVDGSGQVELVWPGRQSVAGLEEGVFVTAEGTIRIGKNGQMQILDPKFTALAK